MPNITIFICAKKMPPEDRLTAFTDQCIALCTNVLHAALEQVHVIYVPVQQGCGHPVFAQVQYRLAPFRTPPVMEQFMEGLDGAIRCHADLTARIRCFGYAAQSIYAHH